jgi:hypothetical protein
MILLSSLPIFCMENIYGIAHRSTERIAASAARSAMDAHCYCARLRRSDRKNLGDAYDVTLVINPITFLHTFQTSMHEDGVYWMPLRRL